MTNSFGYVMLSLGKFLPRLMLSLKRKNTSLKRLSQKRINPLMEQVKRLLAETDQRLILMVKG